MRNRSGAGLDTASASPHCGSSIDEIDFDLQVAREGHLDRTVHGRSFAADGLRGPGATAAETRADMHRARRALRKTRKSPPQVQEGAVVRRASEPVPDCVERQFGALHDAKGVNGSVGLAGGPVREFDRVVERGLPGIDGPVLGVEAVVAQIVEHDELDREPPIGCARRHCEHHREHGAIASDTARTGPPPMPGGKCLRWPWLHTALPCRIRSSRLLHGSATSVVHPVAALMRRRESRANRAAVAPLPPGSPHPESHPRIAVAPRRRA